MGRRRGEWLGAAAALLLWVSLCHAAPGVGVGVGVERLAPDVRLAHAQALDQGDAAGLPFAVVDKRDARLHVFDAAGTLLGSSPVLLGLALGDEAVDDGATRAPAVFAPTFLAPHRRTTPAGRFESQPGHNDKGEAIVWVDYAASLAIHRLRPAPPGERRPARLASPTPDDNRISLGCVIVPVAFYEAVVEPLLGRRRGVVYVLPETRPAESMFDALAAARLGL